MKTDKADESTRDIICFDFRFGLRSYEEEMKHLKEMRKKAENEEDTEVRAAKLKTIEDLEARVTSRKDLYRKLSKADLRRIIYEEGIDITYDHLDKKSGEVVVDEVIHYKMLYRSPAKAKQGLVMLIREELYDIAYEWITMGIGARLPAHGAKIVEISAYAPLTTSTIEGTMNIPIDDVLLVKDQESFFRTIADIVRAEDYQVYETKYSGKKKVSVPVTKKKCVVNREETDVKNVMWDGMALIETGILPDWCNGMALLRNHFFKACAFRTHIQQFFRDYCAEHGLDYETFTVKDMFGGEHLAKNIKMIVSDNGPKIWKFADLIGGDKKSAYEYWKERVEADGCVWGIVKTDHPSKLGEVQQLSYQIQNSLPVTEEEVYKIAETSVKYVESLKNDDTEFVKYLRKNANLVNSYDMFADLYEWNPGIGNSKFFRFNKSKIINEYITKLKKGKITTAGDNLTVCGNPYALLLYCVSEDWTKDPTLQPEEGVIQCFTKRFEDGEFLCGIRSPQNSANNIGYFHNVRHPLMEKYFDFSNNIMAVNCIHTDVQPRMNGEDSNNQGWF